MKLKKNKKARPSENVNESRLRCEIEDCSYRKVEKHMITELQQKIIDAFLERKTPVYDFIYFYGNLEQIAAILDTAEEKYRARYPEARVIRTDPEAFRADTIHCILNGKRPVRECDLLIFENIGEIAGLEANEERLYYLLDWLLLNHRQAIISGEVPATQLFLIHERIRAQIEGGISVPVE